MSEQFEQEIGRARQVLSSVSPSFCLAKWTQVTLHLQNGNNHSCHHPKVHKIPLPELLANPAALHNTSHKIKQRKLMLKGKRPKECDYCWRIEDAGKNNISDRLYKSSYPWSLPYSDEVLANPLDDKIPPRYLEVNLGNKCNFSCSYCLPEVSSRWLTEIQKYGPYPTSSNFNTLDPSTLPIPEGEHNPYLEAWWKWWPEVYPKLHTFRMTGGEPLLNKNFYRIMDWVEQNPRPDLSLAVNTNLCPPQKQWDQFNSYLRSISDKGGFKRFDVYTSAEAWGNKSDYIRHGMNFELWLERLWRLLEDHPKIKVTIMATYNALSVTSFTRLLEEVQKIKSTECFYNEHRDAPILIDISYLRHPEHQTIKVLTPDYLTYMQESLQFMKNNLASFLVDEDLYQRGFYAFEVHKMERIIQWFNSQDRFLDRYMRVYTLREDFALFFQEHDRRRGTNFLQNFPEMEEFWNLCQSRKFQTKLLSVLRKIKRGIFYC